MATAASLITDAIARSFDAAAINAVCNHPDVLPGLSLGQGEVDVAALVKDRRNIVLMGKFGGALFHRTAPDVYAAHDFFLPEGRGKWALNASRAMLGMMFDGYGARMIWAETPIENRACRFFNRMLGFKSQGVSKAVVLPGHAPVDVETFIMEAAQCP